MYEKQIMTDGAVWGFFAGIILSIFFGVNVWFTVFGSVSWGILMGMIWCTALVDIYTLWD